MSKVDVLSWKKEKVGSVDLDAEVFAAEVKKCKRQTQIEHDAVLRHESDLAVQAFFIVFIDISAVKINFAG